MINIDNTEDVNNVSNESIVSSLQDPSQVNEDGLDVGYEMEINEDSTLSLQLSADEGALQDEVDEELPTYEDLSEESSQSQNNLMENCHWPDSVSTHVVANSDLLLAQLHSTPVPDHFPDIDETITLFSQPTSSVSKDDIHVQTDCSSSNHNERGQIEMNDLKAQLARQAQQLLQQEQQLKDLQEKLSKTIEGAKLINIIRENNKMTKFYTGLHTWSLFMTIFKLCEPAAAKLSKQSLNQCKLTLQEQFLLTLMRLRLNLNFEDLGYRFGIHQSTVTRYFSKWIDVMYVRLSTNFMVWPARDELRLTMPMFFRKHFRRCVVIIDCFEVTCQRFTDLLDRCSTYSNYKSRPTAKFLIGITPQGTISYISQAYGGRSSDVFITEDSKHIAVVASDKNIISNLLPGDQVLADRGFLIAEAVALMMAELVTPAFRGTRSQLTQFEVETSRRISNVRIHVERVIGQLKRTFTILEGTLTIDELRSDDDGLAFIDKIAFVCCCLLNANEGVVPSS